MDIINQKIIVLSDALKTLQEGIELFYEYENIYSTNSTEKNK